MKYVYNPAAGFWWKKPLFKLFGCEKRGEFLKICLNGTIKYVNERILYCTYVFWTRKIHSLYYCVVRERVELSDVCRILSIRLSTDAGFVAVAVALVPAGAHGDEHEVQREQEEHRERDEHHDDECGGRHAARPQVTVRELIRLSQPKHSYPVGQQNGTNNAVRAALMYRVRIPVRVYYGTVQICSKNHRVS